MNKREGVSLKSLVSACRNAHGLTSAPVDSSYQSSPALRLKKILLPFMCTSRAKGRSKKERLLVSKALAQVLSGIE